MDCFRRLLTVALLFFIGFLPQVKGQGFGYEVIPKPDIWYNDVDGIRLGVILDGQVPGSFGDGPHRLGAGVWLGLWFPDLPVSYYVSFTEPISAWSEFSSEAAIELVSSIRTGYHNHGIGFSKRWQQGFDERKYIEFSNYNSYQRRFDREYSAFPGMWSDHDKVLTSFSLELQNENPLGWYHLSAETLFQLNDERYSVVNLSARQHIPFNEIWGLRVRAFAGFASSDTDPEYLYSRSMMPAIETLGSGFTRAKGTLPQAWLESGNMHIGGGANLRGYTRADVRNHLSQKNVASSDDEGVYGPHLFNSFAAVNVEFDFWNPLSSLLTDISGISDILKFRTYLFMDAGRGLSDSEYDYERGVNSREPSASQLPPPTELMADAGAGISLSFNIPDHYGKPRGFVLRYEIPFWLSEPGEGNDAFDFRSLFGFGAVISF